jgi:hypothetical protein
MFGFRSQRSCVPELLSTEGAGRKPKPTRWSSRPRSGTPTSLHAHKLPFHASLFSRTVSNFPLLSAIRLLFFLLLLSSSSNQSNSAELPVDSLADHRRVRADSRKRKDAGTRRYTVDKPSFRTAGSAAALCGRLTGFSLLLDSLSVQTIVSSTLQEREFVLSCKQQRWSTSCAALETYCFSVRESVCSFSSPSFSALACLAVCLRYVSHLARKRKAHTAAYRP